MLMARCNRFEIAARTAPMASGVATSEAMITPPKAAGACNVSKADAKNPFLAHERQRFPSQCFLRRGGDFPCRGL
jgi:hypothetical protein